MQYSLTYRNKYILSNTNIYITYSEEILANESFKRVHRRKVYRYIYSQTFANTIPFFQDNE